jgi:YtkA-like
VKAYNILLFLVLTFLVSGCSLNDGTETLYKQENALQIDIVIPDKLELGKEEEFIAVLKNADGKAPELKNITFTIWKNGTPPPESIVPENRGNGTYSLSTKFLEEGLYFVKVEASSLDSRVMPTKKFTVGSLTEEDINSLPNQSEGHHHEGHH